ncbi:MAG: ACP synthase [Halolamina sp.]|uniref:zinc ribbon domain-containing protein n=1 Tax=Halolamina sp. TaxID=1940283 RepID=UPI002FC3315D
MTDPSIIGAGVHAPRYRIDADTIAEAWGRVQAAGVAEKRVAAADEDALTMGAAAARRALDAAGIEAGNIAALTFATTTPPLAEEALTPRLAAFLGVENAVHRSLGSSTRAGTQALLVAADTAAFPALVVAADCPRGEPNSPEEHAAGAGAAAFVVDAHAEGTGAALTERAEYVADYPGTRFREQGEGPVHGLGISSYDRQAYRECVSGAIGRLEADIVGAAEALALQAPDGKRPGRAAGVLDTDAKLFTVATDHGDLGAASAPAALAQALAAGCGSVLAVGFGSGAGADALLFEGTTPVVSNADQETEVVDYPQYLRLRGELDSGSPAGGGAQVSVPSWRRQRGARYRLDAGHCPKCGALAFPADGACPECHNLGAYEPTRLSHTGTVETVTGVSPGGAPPEFAQQAERGGDFGVAIVSFPPQNAETAETAETERTASVPMQVTETDPERVEAGDAVEAVIRRIYTQEGVTRYGRKVRPTE